MPPTPAPPELYATTYPRQDCAIGVVHLGYGAFHRAHQAVYFDDYMQMSGDLNWGIAAVNLRAEHSAEFAAASAKSTYLLKTTDGENPPHYRRVRAHLTFADASTDLENALQLGALPSLRAVTVTVSESGYYLTPERELDLAHPTIQDDLKTRRAATVYGFLAQLLAIRAAAKQGGIGIYCCDNLRENGALLGRNFFAFLVAAQLDEAAAWAKTHVTFPCAMVDRITPRTTPELNAEIQTLFPQHAANPIQSETYAQWVIEKTTPQHLPPLSQVGAEFVESVHPYENAKIRILNGGHTALAYFAALANYPTFAQAMRDPKLRTHFEQLMAREILPALGDDLPFNKQTYAAEVAARFCYAAIADRVARICMDGFAKTQLFIRPTVEDCLAQGITPKYAIASIASWYVFARRYADEKSAQLEHPIPYFEPNWDLLAPTLAVGGELKFAHLPELWGDLPKRYGDFAAQLIQSIQQVQTTWQK